MRSFEATFGIPPEHRLELVRSRVRGGMPRGEYWQHQEFDARGVLVARYESFTEIDAAGVACSGWYRYDRDGFLIDRHDEIAEPFGELLA